MNSKEFYALLDQAGHRLRELASSSPGYEHELRKLIAIVQKESKSIPENETN